MKNKSLKRTMLWSVFERLKKKGERTKLGDHYFWQWGLLLNANKLCCGICVFKKIYMKLVTFLIFKVSFMSPVTF